MVHVRSSGIALDLPFRGSMTAAAVIEQAGLRGRWSNPRYSSIQIGSRVVDGQTRLKDEDTVVVAPKIQNG